MQPILKLALIGLAILAVALPAQGAEYKFTLINKSALGIAHMYVGPSSSEDWGDDILDKVGEIAPGGEATITVVTVDDECLYDFRFETPDGVELEQYEQNVCSLTDFTLR